MNLESRSNITGRNTATNREKPSTVTRTTKQRRISLLPLSTPVAHSHHAILLISTTIPTSTMDGTTLSRLFAVNLVLFALSCIVVSISLAEQSNVSEKLKEYDYTTCSMRQVQVFETPVHQNISNELNLVSCYYNKHEHPPLEYKLGAKPEVGPGLLACAILLPLITTGLFVVLYTKNTEH
jgi:hypothetical protein